MAGKASSGGDSVLCPGTEEKAGFTRHVIIPDFAGHPPCCGFRPGWTTSAATHGQTSGGRFIRYTQHIAGPTGQDMLNTIADGIFHRRKRAPRFRWHRAPRAGFRHLHRPAGVIAFLPHQTKGGASGGSATSDRWVVSAARIRAHVSPRNRCFVLHRAPPQVQP